MILHLSRNTKMSDLIQGNPHLLEILPRMGIEGSFGEKTVDEICIQSGLDTDTFIILCRTYTDPDFKVSENLLRQSHISDILRYLHQSHDYYIRKALESLASEIEQLIVPCTELQKSVILRFFTDYKAELLKHFTYEENEVIPYIQRLLIGQRTPGFSIDMFEENHSNIDEKLSDLISIVMKSLPDCCDGTLRTDLLRFMFHLRDDLSRHTYIEDRVMVPMVRLIENPQAGNPRRAKEVQENDEEQEELSAREKEILVSVAMGMINKEIADKHNISINTVITHRKNITRKTGIKTVAGLTVYAILNNLIDINSIE